VLRNGPQQAPKKQRGFALVEFAICLPVLALVALFVLEAGLYLNQYLLLTRAVHEGVMFAARKPSVTTQQVQTRVRTTIQAYSSLGRLPLFTLNSDTIIYTPNSTDHTVRVELQGSFSTLLGVLKSFKLSGEGGILI
jgi:Flp pilus assembly protein TadG